MPMNFLFLWDDPMVPRETNCHCWERLPLCNPGFSCTCPAFLFKGIGWAYCGIWIWHSRARLVSVGVLSDLCSLWDLFLLGWGPVVWLSADLPTGLLASPLSLWLTQHCVYSAQQSSLFFSNMLWHITPLLTTLLGLPISLREKPKHLHYAEDYQD